MIKFKLTSRRSAVVIGSTIFVLLFAGFLTLKYGRDESRSASTTSNSDAANLLTSSFDSGPAAKVPTENEFLSGLKGQTNPLTGEPYNEDQIRRIHYLAETFPRNSLIPRPSGDFNARTEQRTRFMDQIARGMTAGTATPEHIDAYFDLAERLVKDRIQIAEFVTGERQWPEAARVEFKAVNDQSRKILENLYEERKAAKAGFEKRRNSASRGSTE